MDYDFDKEQHREDMSDHLKELARLAVLLNIDVIKQINEIEAEIDK